MIELRSVSKSFGQVNAVDEISFATKEGEIFGLLGPNGAGQVHHHQDDHEHPRSRLRGASSSTGSPSARTDKDRIGYLPEERGLYRKVKINEMLLYLASLKNADTGRGGEAAGRVACPFRSVRMEDTDAGRAFQGHGAEGPVHRLHPPRPRVPLPRRAVLRPRPGEHGRAAGSRPRAGKQGQDDPVLHAQHGGRGEDLLADPRDRSRPRGDLRLRLPTSSRATATIPSSWSSTARSISRFRAREWCATCPASPAGWRSSSRRARAPRIF